MTSQKRTQHHASLLGTNDLRGGLHLYSPDVLTENWFDQRLAPGFEPNQKKGRSVAVRHQPTGRERLAAFNKTNRTNVSILTNTRHKTQTIPTWYPPDPYMGHPPIPSPFETMYECTLGDPKYKNAPIPVGPNLFQYQTFPESERLTTEHRTAYCNPAHRPMPSEPAWYSGADDCFPECLDERHLTHSVAGDRRQTLTPQEIPQHKYNVPLEIQQENRLPVDRLVPTSTLGTPPNFQRF